jgi:uroporphyrinogen decarboxylase
MTSRERVLKAFSRRPPDRVPATLYGEIVGYVPAVAQMLKSRCGGLSPLDYFKFDITSVSPATSRVKADFSPYIPADRRSVVDEWGVGWQGGSYLHYAHILHPLESLTAQQIREYPFPDLDAAYRYDGIQGEIAALHERGLAVACFPGSIFEQAWFMRGMQQLFADLAEDRTIANFLLDRITGIVTAASAQLAAAGLDLLILGDDIASQRGMMMSLAMWREVFKPRLARVIRAAKDAAPNIHIFYHSDGNVWDAIPDLIDAGVTVLNPIQPECMDPAAVKRAFGDRLSFFGTVSVQRTMPFGTPEAVRAEVRLRMQTVGKGGGLLLAPAHVLQPDTPWENIVAFFEAVEEYGRY